MEVDLHYVVRMFLALLQDNFNNIFQVLIWLNNDPRYKRFISSDLDRHLQDIRFPHLIKCRQLNAHALSSYKELHLPIIIVAPSFFSSIISH